MSDDWLLSYPGVDLPFGSVDSGYFFSQHPDVGAFAISRTDYDVPGEDGTQFGVDLIGGQTITFELTVNGYGERDGLDRLATLKRAWRADPVRRVAGAVATLRASSGRVTYGRPRRFIADPRHLNHGIPLVTADFATTTDLWFGDESQASVTLVPAPGGGLIAPLQSPLATTTTSDRSTAIVVGGEVPTFGIYEIEGPLTDPVVEVVGLFRLAFRGTLAYDQTLVIDTRPHMRTALRNGASVSLAPTSTRMAQTALPPGQHELVLRGASDTGTARVTARWRDAFTTY